MSLNSKCAQIFNDILKDCEYKTITTIKSKT